MKSRHQCLALVMTLAIVVGSTGCSNEERAEIDPSIARAHVVGALRARLENASRTTLGYESLEELLPNVDYVFDDGSSAHASALAVVGTIVDLEEGRGFVVDDKHPDGIASDFDDPDALWWTAHAVVKIEDKLGGDYDGDEVRVGWTLTSKDDFEVTEVGLQELGRVVLFLFQRQPPEYEPSLWRIVEDGALLVTVDESGKLALPVAEPERAKMLLGDADLAALEDAARSDGKTIEMAGSPGSPERVDRSAPKTADGESG